MPEVEIRAVLHILHPAFFRQGAFFITRLWLGCHEATQMPTVLVVDDNDEVCQMLETYFRCEGLDVLTASNGRDALRELAGAVTQPSVILLDLMMPIMDGIEFRRHQQADMRLRDIPVVCLSARHDALQTAARLGVREFFWKPFELDDVAAAVRRLCAA